MQIVRYCVENAEEWDDFVANSLNGTFLHTRRYLGYHGERFRDSSVLIKDENEKVIGLFPAAVDPNNERRIISHPGITYGGILHKGGLRGMRMIEAFAELEIYYCEGNFDAIQYKAVPQIYHRAATDDDLYALFVKDAVRNRCDLSCAIDLTNRVEISSRRKRSLKKALRYGVQVDEGERFAEDLWRVLKENLESKYEARPIHSLEQITLLQSLFPERIKFVAALLNQKVIAGIVLYLTETVNHVQYIASSSVGYETSALDAIFNHCIEVAANEGKRWFDFGTSNEDEGRKLNMGLYNFKSEFGGGGIAHEFYELNLR